MRHFTPTHTITTDRETVVVMLDDDGRAYQRCEWDAVDAASYELQDDGRWTFQGEAFSGTVREMNDAGRTQWFFREAESRVRADDRLSPHAAVILDDRGDGDDHWQWVIAATTDDIAAWAKEHAR